MKVTALLLVILAAYVSCGAPPLKELTSNVKETGVLPPLPSLYRDGKYFRIFVPYNTLKLSFELAKDSTCHYIRYAIRNQGFFPCNIDTPNNQLCWDNTYEVKTDYISSATTSVHFDTSSDSKFFKLDDYWHIAVYKYDTGDKDKECHFELTAKLEVCPPSQIAVSTTECAPYSNVTLASPVTTRTFTKATGGDEVYRIPHLEYGVASLQILVQTSRSIYGVYGRTLGPASDSVYGCRTTSGSGSNPTNYTLECKTPKWGAFYLRFRDDSTTSVDYTVRIEKVTCPTGKAGLRCLDDITTIQTGASGPFTIPAKISDNYNFRYFKYNVSFPYFNYGPYKVTFTNTNGASQTAYWRWNAFPTDDSSQGYDGSYSYSSFSSQGTSAKLVLNPEDNYHTGIWIFAVQCQSTVAETPCSFNINVQLPDNSGFEPTPPVAPPVGPNENGWETTFTGALLPTVGDIGDAYAPKVYQFYVPANASKVTVIVDNLNQGDCSWLRYIVRPKWRPCSTSSESPTICSSDSSMMYNDGANVGSTQKTKSFDATDDFWVTDSTWHIGISRYSKYDGKTCGYHIKVVINQCPTGQYSTGDGLCTPHKVLSFSQSNPITNKLSLISPTGNLFVKIPQVPARTSQITITVVSALELSSGVYARFQAPVASSRYDCYTYSKTGDGPFTYALTCPTPKWSSFYIEVRGNKENTFHVTAEANVCPHGTAGPNCQFSVTQFPPETSGPFTIHSTDKPAYNYYLFNMTNPPYELSSNIKIKVTNQNSTSVYAIWRYNAFPAYESGTGYDSSPYFHSASSIASVTIHPEDVFLPGSYYLGVACVTSNKICSYTLDGTAPPPPPTAPVVHTPTPVGTPVHTPTPVGTPVHTPTPTNTPTPTGTPVHTPTPVNTPTPTGTPIPPAPFNPSSPQTPFAVGNPSAIDNPPVVQPGLSGGAIAAIVIVAIFVVAGVAAGITYFVNKSKQTVQSESLAEKLIPEK